MFFAKCNFFLFSYLLYKGSQGRLARPQTKTTKARKKEKKGPKIREKAAKVQRLEYQKLLLLP